eukprot:3446948-Rhodomonas_salina.4
MAVAFSIRRYRSSLGSTLLLLCWLLDIGLVDGYRLKYILSPPLHPSIHPSNDPSILIFCVGFDYQPREIIREHQLETRGRVPAANHPLHSHHRMDPLIFLRPTVRSNHTSSFLYKHRILNSSTDRCEFSHVSFVLSGCESCSTLGGILFALCLRLRYAMSSSSSNLSCPHPRLILHPLLWYQASTPTHSLLTECISAFHHNFSTKTRKLALISVSATDTARAVTSGANIAPVVGDTVSFYDEWSNTGSQVNKGSRYPTALRAPYAIPGTDMLYAPTRRSDPLRFR